MARFIHLLLAGSLLLPASVSADDVYLKNGRKFEGVIAEVTGSHVRIRLQGGSLSLPKSHVLRVESGDSALSEYLERKEALRRDVDADARDWVELARWAVSRGLQQGAREAAVAAAELDLRAEGLAPILRGFRYVLDEELGRWLSYEESMRRRGFVFVHGAWISREELAQRDRQREQEASRRRSELDAARAERTARQTELLLATQAVLLQETLRERDREQAYTPYPYGWPVVVIPGHFPPPCCRKDPHHPPSEGGVQRPPRDQVDEGRGSFRRIPGSLIPGRPGANLSSSSKP